MHTKWLNIGIVFLGMHSLVGYAKPELLTDFGTIKAALQEGRLVTAYINFTNCTPGVPLQGYSLLDKVMITPTQMTTYAYHIRLDHPLYPGVPVGEYLQSTLTYDGTVTVAPTLLDVATGAILSLQPSQEVCHLGPDVQFYGT